MHQGALPLKGLIFSRGGILTKKKINSQIIIELKIYSLHFDDGNKQTMQCKTIPYAQISAKFLKVTHQQQGLRMIKGSSQQGFWYQPYLVDYPTHLIHSLDQDTLSQLQPLYHNAVHQPVDQGFCIMGRFETGALVEINIQ